MQDLADYERFIKETLTRIAGIANIESSFALTQVKHSNVPADRDASNALAGGASAGAVTSGGRA